MTILRPASHQKLRSVPLSVGSLQTGLSVPARSSDSVGAVRVHAVEQLIPPNKKSPQQRSGLRDHGVEPHSSSLEPAIELLPLRQVGQIEAKAAIRRKGHLLSLWTELLI